MTLRSVRHTFASFFGCAFKVDSHMRAQTLGGFLDDWQEVPQDVASSGSCCPSRCLPATGRRRRWGKLGTHAVSAFAAPAEKQLVAHPRLLRSRLSGSSAPFGFLWCHFVQIVGEWGLVAIETSGLSQGRRCVKASFWKNLI